jgi:death-on-curing protein
MDTITTEKIVEIHNYAIKEFGGTDGILHLGTIDYLVYQINSKTNEFEKAALVLNQIITRHPFFDGHKRTAFQVADIILRNKGYHIHADKKEIETFLLKIASYDCNISKIEKWLKRKCRRQKKSRQLQLGQAHH